MTSWMDKSVESDVNTAIQSQVIQTALESNVSAANAATEQINNARKCVRLSNHNAQGPAPVSTWFAISYGGAGPNQPPYTYNYGGFNWTLAGGNPSQVIIPERGVYLCVASWSIAQACEYYTGWSVISTWGGCCSLSLCWTG